MEDLNENLRNLTLDNKKNPDTMTKEVKQQTGSFMTTRSKYITQGINIPKGVSIIEPCVGNGDLLKVIPADGKHVITTYDIRNMSEKKHPNFYVRDVITSPPDYKNAFVLANPPYLARNKSKNKAPYDYHGLNDLYKCFINTLINNPPLGGVLIIPLNFWCSIRVADAKLRKAFTKRFKITRFNMFTSPVFEDTTYNVCCFQFERCKQWMERNSFMITIIDNSKKHKNTINEADKKHKRPANQTFNVILNQDNNWTIGGELYKMPFGEFTRATSKNRDKHNSRINIHCIDNKKKIHAEYVNEKTKLCIDETKNLTARSSLTLITPKRMTEQKQKDFVVRWNAYLISQREKYKSLFLPNYRDNNRKRISFDLVYRIAEHVNQI